MDHDAAWKRLFGLPILIEHLLKGFASPVAARLDFSTLRQLPANSVDADARQRHGGAAWRVTICRGTTWSPRRAVFDWPRLVAPRMFPQSDAAGVIASLEREFPEIATEEGTVMALAKRVQEWEAEWHRQGFEKGLKEGLERGIAQGRKQGVERGFAAERELLCRLATRKFGAAAGDALARHLADISDPDRLAAIGERIIDCRTGAELLEWLDADSDGADAH